MKEEKTCENNQVRSERKNMLVGHICMSPVVNADLVTIQSGDINLEGETKCRSQARGEVYVSISHDETKSSG